MATETTTSASACVDASGGAIGMPQLCPEWFANQIFWLVIALLAIFFVLSKIALPRIAAVLAERSGTISNDLAAAEDLKRKAVAAEEAYNKALADARAEAQAIAAETRAEIKADLDVAIAKADAEIAAKTAEGEAKIAEIRAGAMASVQEVASDVASELVSVLGQSADSKAVADAVAARLKG